VLLSLGQPPLQLPLPTQVADGPDKIYLGGIPNYFNDEQVRFSFPQENSYYLVNMRDKQMRFACHVDQCASDFQFVPRLTACVLVGTLDARIGEGTAFRLRSAQVFQLAQGSSHAAA
jgi:hypothetical protein